MLRLIRHIFLGIAAFLALTATQAGGGSQVRVIVLSEQLQGYVIQYHYTIVNQTSKPVNEIVIGSRYDQTQKDTLPELGKLPVESRFGKEGEVGTEVHLDPASTTQPRGWVPSVYGAQDSGFYFLRWRSTNRSIAPGQTLSGFSVRVPTGQDPNLKRMPVGSDTAYGDGHFTVGHTSGEETHGTIERKDATFRK